MNSAARESSPARTLVHLRYRIALSADCELATIGALWSVYDRETAQRRQAGSRPKRKPWFEALAADLKREGWEGKDRGWESVAENPGDLSVIAASAAWIVCRDVDGDGAERLYAYPQDEERAPMRPGRARPRSWNGTPKKCDTKTPFASGPPATSPYRSRLETDHRRRAR